MCVHRRVCTPPSCWRCSLSWNIEEKLTALCKQHAPEKLDDLLLFVGEVAMQFQIQHGDRAWDEFIPITRGRVQRDSLGKEQSSVIAGVGISSCYWYSNRCSLRTVLHHERSDGSERSKRGRFVHVLNGHSDEGGGGQATWIGASDREEVLLKYLITWNKNWQRLIQQQENGNKMGLLIFLHSIVWMELYRPKQMVPTVLMLVQILFQPCTTILSRCGRVLLRRS